VIAAEPSELAIGAMPLRIEDHMEITNAEKKDREIIIFFNDYIIYGKRFEQ